jgi:nitrogenase iron protein NifH
MAQHIALYGKGGVGKTTLALNIGAALAESGQKVLLISGDPKTEVATMLHTKQRGTTLQEILATGNKPALEDIVSYGFAGIGVIEVGDPLALSECATSALKRAFSLFRYLHIFDELQPDQVIYDIPGDTCCTTSIDPDGMSRTIRSFIVTSAELKSLHAANSYLRMMEQQQQTSSGVGIIANAVNGPFEEAMITDFAKQLNARVISTVPRSLVVRQCEMYEKTVIEAAPLSNLAFYYRRLAQQLSDPAVMGKLSTPRSMLHETIKLWAKEWGDRINELEFGIIQDGAGI